MGNSLMNSGERAAEVMQRAHGHRWAEDDFLANHVFPCLIQGIHDAMTAERDACATVAELLSCEAREEGLIIESDTAAQVAERIRARNQ